MYRNCNRFFQPNRPTLLPALLAALLLPAFCSAQQNKLVVRAIDPLTVKRGATVTQTLTAVVISGFHVNSDKPRDEFLIPLKLAWSSGPLVVKSITYPKPEEIKVGTQNLLVFTGAFPIQTTFEVAPRATPGPAVIEGKIRYQACNSDMCFRPSSMDVKVPVVIE